MAECKSSGFRWPMKSAGEQKQAQFPASSRATLLALANRTVTLDTRIASGVPIRILSDNGKKTALSSINGSNSIRRHDKF